MRKIYLTPFFVLVIICAYSQKSNSGFSLSVSGGNFIVGHGYITGFWTSIDGSKTISSGQKKLLNKITLGGELYFENGADKATIHNPTPEQFIQDRYYHESNTGFTVKLTYYPFKSFLKGFYVAAGPLIVYSIRTYEKRAQLIQYSPTLSIRMSELDSDNKLLGGYRLTTGYDINFGTHWLAGVRGDFLKYQRRDLNSILGIKVGYRF